MEKMKTLALVFFAIALTGCASNTISELKSDVGNFDGSFETENNYQVVYRNLRNMYRNCLEQAPGGTPVTTEGEIDIGIQEGQIRQRMIAQGVFLNMSVIDVNGITDTKSKVTLNSVKGWLTIGTDLPAITDVERWTKGDKIAGGKANNS
jgi:hypothetical protein